MLEGRYNIASKGVPASIVDDIEILQNHNHAKIDIDRTLSDKVAINLKLKDNKRVLFGTSSIDLGIPLFTASANLTPVYISNKIQSIGSLKSNNFGQTLKYNGMNLISGDYNLSRLITEQYDFISDPETSVPQFDSKFWLDNESYSTTNDLLVKKQKDIILKAGINFNNDNEEIENNSITSYFTDVDTTIVNQSRLNQKKSRNLYFYLSQEINKEKLYFKNKTSVNINDIIGKAIIDQNSNTLNYRTLNKKNQIINSTQIKNVLNGKILNSGIIINYFDNNENSEVSPSVFKDLIPSIDTASSTKQVLKNDHLSLGAYSKYNFNLFNLASSLKQDILLKDESLTTSLFQETNELQEDIAFPFESDFSLKTFRTTTDFKMRYQFSKLSMNVSPSFTFLNLNQKELYSEKGNLNRSFLFFEPSLQLNYEFNYKWKAILSGKYNVKASRFNELFNGIILSNFSSISRNPNQININKLYSADLNVSYADILRGFLFRNNISYNNRTSEFTLSNTIDDDGLIETIALERPALFSQFRNTISMTKKILDVINLKFTYTFSNLKSDLVFNNIAQNTSTNSNYFGLDIGLINIKDIDFNYNGSFNFTDTQSSGFEAESEFLKHDINSIFHLSENLRLNLNFQMIRTSDSTSSEVNKNSILNSGLFFDYSKKMSFRLNIINLFDEKFISTRFSNTNINSQSNFRLRPRQITLGLNFTF